MNQTDAEHNIADFVEEITALLPRQYKIGMVAYQSQVTQILPLGAAAREVEDCLKDISYKDYTNAGAALEAAIRLFSGNQNVTRKIIVISDGEISMKSQAETEEALRSFREVLQTVKEGGIAVDIIALGSEITEETNIYAAADITGGKRYLLESAKELSAFSSRYLLQDCRIPYISIGTISGKEANFSVTLPDAYMDTAKIFLLGEQAGAATNVSCKAGNIQVDTGTGFTVITLNEPAEKEVAIQMSAVQDMDIRAYLNAEYTVALQAESEYSIHEGQAAVYLGIGNSAGKNLLDGHLRDNNELKVTANAESVYYIQRDGKLCFFYQTAESKDIVIQISLPDTYAYYYGETAVTEHIEVPILIIEEGPPPIDWFMWITILLLIIILITIFIWMKRKKRHRPPVRISDRKVVIPINGKYKEEDITSNKYDFCGKISVYVLQSNHEVEYPPETLNLFARCGRETITLQWILDACNLPLEPEGADKILLKPGEGRTLLVKNNSKATALKGRDVLLKSHQYTIHYHEKVTFIFENLDTPTEKSTEIEIHYKDLKINER